MKPWHGPGWWPSAAKPFIRCSGRCDTLNRAIQFENVQGTDLDGSASAANQNPALVLRSLSPYDVLCTGSNMFCLQLFEIAATEGTVFAFRTFAVRTVLFTTLHKIVGVAG